MFRKLRLELCKVSENNVSDKSRCYNFTIMERSSSKRFGFDLKLDKSYYMGKLDSSIFKENQPKSFRNYISVSSSGRIEQWQSLTFTENESLHLSHTNTFCKLGKFWMAMERLLFVWCTEFRFLFLWRWRKRAARLVEIVWLRYVTEFWLLSVLLLALL